MIGQTEGTDDLKQKYKTYGTVGIVALVGIRSLYYGGYHSVKKDPGSGTSPEYEFYSPGQGWCWWPLAWTF